MSDRNNLTLYEEVMLLALKDKQGTPESGGYYNQAVAGAILAELLLTGCVEVQPEKKKQFAIASGARPPADPLLAECLGKIAESAKRQQVRTWVSRFANLKQLKRRVALQLCRKGILREREDKVLLIFKCKIYPELDPRPERAVIERLRQAIFTQTEDLDPRTVVLMALAHHTNLLKNAFDKKKLKERKKRIEAVVNGEVIGAATKEAVQAAQAAAAMVAIMPAVVVTTTTT